MKLINTSIIYENPMPALRSRQAMFPSICKLDNGDILASYQIGEAFESIDCTDYISKSVDGGLTFSQPVQMFNKRWEKPIKSDTCKITKLDGDKVVALGYQFIRKDHSLPLGNPKTGGLLEDQVFFSISKDNGKTWGKRKVIKCFWGPHVEASAPIVVLADGSWATPITGFNDWEVSKETPCQGRILRSYNEGKTWNDDVVCMQFEDTNVSCFEQRMCQTTNGNIVVIGWNENLKTGELLNNHVVISTDNGKTFSEPIDTGIKGQASFVLALDDNKVLALHSMRRDCEKPGILACIVDLSQGKWDIIEKELIWSPNVPIVKDNNFAAVFAYLKFGQPSAIRINEKELLMTHWAQENGQYKTYCSKIEL